MRRVAMHAQILVNKSTVFSSIKSLKCDSTPPNEADVGNNHFESSKQMCSKVKIGQILYGGLR